METIVADGITIYYPSLERPAARLLHQTAEESVLLNQGLWGLSPPQDFRLYVMTDWRDFLSHAAPWHWRIAILLTSPILYPRIERMWPFVGGWEQRFGKRVAVGVKPPGAIQESDASFGNQIFKQTKGIDQKFRITACHEINHAFCSHLALPAWLKEGIAMVTVDHYAGEQTVLQDTLDTITKRMDLERSGGYRSMRVKGPDEMVYIYVRGYWVTRYLEDTQPGLLKGLLDRRCTHKELETRLAEAYNMTHEQFWGSINEAVVSRYATKENIEHKDTL